MSKKPLRVKHMRAKWFYEAARDEFRLRRAGDYEYEPGRDFSPEAMADWPCLTWEEAALLIEYLRETYPQLVTGFGLKRDPEDIKLLNRLVDVIQLKSTGALVIPNRHTAPE